MSQNERNQKQGAKRCAVLALCLLLAAALCLVFAACRDGANEQPPETQSPTSDYDSYSELPTWPETLPSDELTPPEQVPQLVIPGLEPEATEPMAAAPSENAVFPSPQILKGVQDPNAKTYTGLRALETRPIAIADPNNSGNLPAKKIEHSFGAAKNGIVHQISQGYQKFFDDKKYPAVVYDNQTQTEKRIYLTFDCGYENGNTAKILDVLKEKQVPAAFFCTVDEMKGAPDIVARMINEGHIVGNHSVTHPSFAAIDRAAMAKEVLDADNYLRTNFGYSAPFFRFPKGEYTESALEAVGSLGFTSVFWSAAYSDWDVNQQKGAQYALDTMLARLHPGTIVLLHSVSKDNADAMAAFIDKCRGQGFVFRELTELPAFRP